MRINFFSFYESSSLVISIPVFSVLFLLMNFCTLIPHYWLRICSPIPVRLLTQTSELPIHHSSFALGKRSNVDIYSTVQVYSIDNFKWIPEPEDPHKRSVTYVCSSLTLTCFMLLSPQTVRPVSTKQKRKDTARTIKRSKNGNLSLNRWHQSPTDTITHIKGTG